MSLNLYSFQNSNNDVDECFQVDLCHGIKDGMTRNLTYKDVIEYVLVNSCESSKHEVALCEKYNEKRLVETCMRMTILMIVILLI